MQRIERPDKAPNILVSSKANEARLRMRNFWALAPQRRAQTNIPPVGVNSDNEELVIALAEMTGGRCAFCEGEDQLFAHRFRPIGNALPLQERGSGHLYYLWLGDAWQNLYPICVGCIPKEPQFPIDGNRASLPSLQEIEDYLESKTGLWPSFPPNENSLLLDPVCDQAFENHILPKLDGELIGKSPRGELTIAIHNLNRGERRNQRNQAYHARIGSLLEYMTVSPGKMQDDRLKYLLDFPNLEFGGTWYLVLRRLAGRIRRLKDERWGSSRTYIRNFYLNLVTDRNGHKLVQRALEEVKHEDANIVVGEEVHSLRTPIATVEIENFKAIEKLNLKFGPPRRTPNTSSGPSAPSLVILGENATGKSSILEGVALALTTPAARNYLKIPWSKMVLDPTQLGADRDLIQRRATIRISLTSGQTATLTIDGGLPSVRSEFGNQQVPVFAYGAFRRFLTGTRRAAPHMHIRNLFDGSTLSNPEPWLKKLPADTFNLVIRTVRDLLSVEGEFDVIQRERGQLRIVTSLTEPDGNVRYSRTPLQAVSSGYRSMLAMVCDIMRGLLDPRVYEKFESFQTVQGIVLIDEIEAHLHPRWKVQVMTSLRTALPGMTFIVTTHDPLCLRGMGEDEVVVLQRVASSEVAQVSRLPILVERITDLPAVANLRIEQLLTSDFFQLLSSDDAASDRKLAHIGDLIAAKARGALAPEDEAVLSAFEADIASALPVGSSEVHRMVQEAVAEYLSKRRKASSSKLKAMRQEAKNEILRALELL